MPTPIIPTLLDVPREKLAERIWAEVAEVTRIEEALPPWQIVKEKRATFAATVDENARRPGARTVCARRLDDGRVAFRPPVRPA